MAVIRGPNKVLKATKNMNLILWDWDTPMYSKVRKSHHTNQASYKKEGKKKRLKNPALRCSADTCKCFSQPTQFLYMNKGQRGQTQAPLLLFQGWMTPTTMIATISNRIMMAMHIHFREFFWSFLAFWSADVPLWTWSTAVLTWTILSLTQIEINMRCILWTYITYIQKIKDASWTQTNLAFNVI